jgi:hypothetical protein
MCLCVKKKKNMLNKKCVAKLTTHDEQLYTHTTFQKP